MFGLILSVLEGGTDQSVFSIGYWYGRNTSLFLTLNLPAYIFPYIFSLHLFETFFVAGWKVSRLNHPFYCFSNFFKFPYKDLVYLDVDLLALMFLFFHAPAKNCYFCHNFIIEHPLLLQFLLLVAE